MYKTDGRMTSTETHMAHGSLMLYLNDAFSQYRVVGPALLLALSATMAAINATSAHVFGAAVAMFAPYACSELPRPVDYRTGTLV
jgi:hypothetical protein